MPASQGGDDSAGLPSVVTSTRCLKLKLENPVAQCGGVPGATPSCPKSTQQSEPVVPAPAGVSAREMNATRGGRRLQLDRRFNPSAGECGDAAGKATVSVNTSMSARSLEADRRIASAGTGADHARAGLPTSTINSSRNTYRLETDRRIKSAATRDDHARAGFSTSLLNSSRSTYRLESDRRMKTARAPLAEGAGAPSTRSTPLNSSRGAPRAEADGVAPAGVLAGAIIHSKSMPQLERRKMRAPAVAAQDGVLPAGMPAVRAHEGGPFPSCVESMGQPGTS